MGSPSIMLRGRLASDSVARYMLCYEGWSLENPNVLLISFLRYKLIFLCATMSENNENLKSSLEWKKSWHRDSRTTWIVFSKKEIVGKKGFFELPGNVDSWESQRMVGVGRAEPMTRIRSKIFLSKWCSGLFGLIRQGCANQGMKTGYLIFAFVFNFKAWVMTIMTRKDSEVQSWSRRQVWFVRCDQMQSTFLKNGPAETTRVARDFLLESYWGIGNEECFVWLVKWRRLQQINIIYIRFT